MTPEELSLFTQPKREYKIKATGEVVSFDWIVKIIGIYQERLKKLSEATELVDFFFKAELDFDPDLLKWGSMTNKDVVDSLEKAKKVLILIDSKEWTKEKLEASLFLAAGQVERGKLLWPLRVALTGKKASASPFDVATILGKEKTIERIGDAIKRLQNLDKKL